MSPATGIWCGVSKPHLVKHECVPSETLQVIADQTESKHMIAISDRYMGIASALRTVYTHNRVAAFS
jgi:hypothetical protein